MSTQSKEANPEVFWELLQGARKGSKKHLGILLLLFEKHLLAFAHEHLPADLRGRLGSSDLVQETFAKANGYFLHFDGNTLEEAFSWLLTILKNNLQNHIREQHRTKRDVTREVGLGESLPARHRSPLDDASRLEQAENLRNCLDSLSLEARQLLYLRFFEELPYDEIATRQGYSTETARQRCGDALRGLSDSVRNLGA